jgi:hypothetical protein
MWVAVSELPRSVSHRFYEKLNGLLAEHGFDDFVEENRSRGTLVYGRLAGDRLLQGGAEKRGAYSLPSHGDSDKLVNRSGAKNAQEQRLDLRMFFDPRQRDLPRGGRRVKSEVE